MTLSEIEQLVKSKKRIADHGEVFTPAWLVDDMLGLVGNDSARIDARVLEPACGSGNFLVPVLVRKLESVEAQYGSKEFERRHFALFSLMCIYGIELLADNAQECRENLEKVFTTYLNVRQGDDWTLAARAVLGANIIQGDALSMTTPDGEPLAFPEWGHLGKGTFQRRDFDYRALTQRSSFDHDTLFGQAPEVAFPPKTSYPKLTYSDIAQWGRGS